MLLHNLNIIGNGSNNHIYIDKGKIKTISNDEKSLQLPANIPKIHFDEAMGFPGLINSHDHLDFNLFPQLGNKVYNNYIEWGSDIHTKNRSIIDSIAKIPKTLRTKWGMYKNLLNGITTVVNHGKLESIENPIIDVFKKCYSLHSVRLERSWKFKLNNPFTKNRPFVIHVGEGTDQASFEEINELIKWNIFKRELIAVHGVAMNEIQAQSFKALIWCPDSNYFLLNKTAKIKELKKKTTILFGTDSTLTASWNFWEHLRFAKELNLLTEKELFDSITNLPAKLWKLTDRGILSEGRIADIIVAKQIETDSLQSFFQSNPDKILLVIKKGEVILFDELLSSQLSFKAKDFTKIYVNNSLKYVKGELDLLIKEIQRYNSDINFPIVAN